MSHLSEIARWAGRNGKRMAVTVLGFALLLAGLAMLVLPGPGALVIIAGLAVLGTEYAWARRALAEAKRKARQATKKAKSLRRKRKT